MKLTEKNKRKVLHDEEDDFPCRDHGQSSSERIEQAKKNIEYQTISLDNSYGEGLM